MPAPKDSSISGFFGSHYNPYYIYAPNYLHSSAGVRSLHYLCHALNELGCEAYVSPATQTNPSLRTPTLSPETLKNHYLTGKTPIAVQPETVGGNFFSTPHVAHWLLNRPGHLSRGSTYTDKLAFHFAEWTRPPGLATDLLTLPLMDLAVFNNEDNPHDSHRELECYYAHKYLSFGHEVPQDIRDRAVSLCQDIPRTPAQLAAILRNAKVLYCYEETALIAEALLCGCPVMLMPSEYLKKENWRADWIPQGAAWADEAGPLDTLGRQINGFREKYETTHTYCWNTVQNFIATTHKAFTLSERTLPASMSIGPMEKLWNLPKSRRAGHLDEFLAAAAHLPAFSHLQRDIPVLELAHWLNQTASTARGQIPGSPFQATAVAPPPAAHPFAPQEESRLFEQLTGLLKHGHIDEAVGTLEDLAAHGTLNWTVYETLGQIHAERNKLDEAAEVLLRGATLEFSTTNCLRKLAAVYAMKGELWRTLAACAGILKREPDDTELHLFVRDVLQSTSPRFDDISWLAPEWSETIEALNKYQGQARAARALLDKLQAKAHAVLEQFHPLTGRQPSAPPSDDVPPTPGTALP